jgi:magnesium-protoporphyrin IX monomethyl ester (oxidative) cyclase/phosphonoacetaldehyde methylase
MMSDRILFVAPAKLNPVDADGRPVQNVRENISLPALIILGSLRGHGYDVDFIDLSADGNLQTPVTRNVHRFGLPDEFVVEKISETKPLALLTTSMFTTEQQMIDDLTAKVRAAFPKLPIIVGGIHASLKPDWILESGNVDVVVMGEGELAILELIELIKEGKDDYERIGGLAYRRNGAVRITPPRSLIGDLTRLQFSFDDVLMRNGSYRYVEPTSKRTALYNHLTQLNWDRCFSLYYSRGCPLHCDYCASSEKDGLKVRHMGGERMFEDFRKLHRDYKVSIFYNQADTFCGNQRDIEFLHLVREYRKQREDFVISNPNAFYVRIFFPASEGYEMNEELLDLLADSGINVVTLAVETFSQKYNKKINFERIPPSRIGELLTAIHQRGMKTGIYMMYAFPEQDSEELSLDEKIVESLPSLDRVDWQNCMVFPGTQYYRRGLAEGWFTNRSYRQALKKGYFFHALPPEFNFSRIPMSDIKAFRERNHSDFQ